MNSDEVSFRIHDMHTDPQSQVDPTSLMNILVPLDLYKQASFPGEQSYDSLLALFLTYFKPKPQTPSRRQTASTRIDAQDHKTPITPEFLFSIRNILSPQAPMDTVTELRIPARTEDPESDSIDILPSVLGRLRLWRVLPAEDRNTEASLGALALDLAGLVNSTARGPPPQNTPRMRIRWIGRALGEESVRDPGSTSRDTLADRPKEKGGEGRLLELHLGSEPSGVPGLFSPCQSAPHHETAAYRSGCCACRLPRHAVMPSADHPTACAGSSRHLGDMRELVPRVNHEGSSLSLDIRASNSLVRTNEKCIQDENVPPVPQLNPAKHPHRIQAIVSRPRSAVSVPALPAKQTVSIRSGTLSSPSTNSRSHYNTRPLTNTTQRSNPATHIPASTPSKHPTIPKQTSKNFDTPDPGKPPRYTAKPNSNTSTIRMTTPAPKSKPKPKSTQAPQSRSPHCLPRILGHRNTPD